MAAPQYVCSRTGQSEERAGSIESFVTSRKTLPTVSHVSFERPVSPGQVAEPPGKSMWEQICEEYEAELPTFPEVYKAKPEAVISVSPLEGTFFHGFNAEHLYSIPHLAKDSHITCTPVKSETADPETCSPKEYLETFIFPILLPGMASLLHQAKKEKCFERKRTKFIACDFLTEWLYNQNPKRKGEPFTEFFSIPFVEQWLKQHPRPPIPLSLLLTEEEAALYIQAFWRAYLFLPLGIPKLFRSLNHLGLSLNTDALLPPHVDRIRIHGVRCDPEVQELRRWQKKLREDKHIRERVKVFWARQEQKVKCTMEEEEAEAETPAL